jgi:hypothetical protein
VISRDPFDTCNGRQVQQYEPMTASTNKATPAVRMRSLNWMTNASAGQGCSLVTPDWTMGCATVAEYFGALLGSIA